MTLDEFLANRRKLLDAFEEKWRAQNRRRPKDYPLDVGNLADWVEQLDVFDETEPRE